MKNRNKEFQKEVNSSFSKAGPYLSIVYFFMASILILGFIGYKADQYFNFDFVFLLTGLFSGFALGFYNMYKVISGLNNNSE